ncbi:hypothetical protein HD806DRAFT_523393 [Xylariaceae sp. AK1471]|nr:hypothetical protein HD806DRAFT_523393 [Xylariaceae sp. AK1471]
MAQSHTIKGSRTSFPTANLRPAPLRIPPRKTGADLDHNDDDARTAVTTHRDGARETSTSTLSQKDSSQSSQADSTHSLSQRRATGHKLEPLVARFEMLDAVNSTDASAPRHLDSSRKAKLSIIPRATGSNQTLQQESIKNPPIELLSRGSLEIFPHRIHMPFAPDRKSRLPVSTQPMAENPNVIAHGRPDDDHDSTRLCILLVHSPFGTSTIPALRHSGPLIESKEASTSRLPRSKSSREKFPSRPQSPSTSVKSLQAATESCPNKTVPERQEVPQKLSEDFKLAPGLDKLRFQQRPSVADLRRSFEKYSQPVELPGRPGRLNLHSKPSLHSTRQSQDMPSTSGFKSRSEMPLGGLPIPEGTSGAHPPQFSRGQISPMGSKSKTIGLTSPTRSVGDLVGRGSTTSLQKSSRSSQRQVHQEMSKSLDRPAKWEPVSHTINGRSPQERANDVNLEISMDGSSCVPLSEQQTDITLEEAPVTQSEQTVTEGVYDRSPLVTHKDPETLSPDSLPSQGNGKVSQIRKLFERSVRRISSSLSSMNLRLRLDTEEFADEQTGACPSPSRNESESPLSAPTVKRRRSVTPSLTTEISVNDFFCDFVGSPNHRGSQITASPYEASAKPEPRTKQESPVKHRIQQFEHLSRDSLNIRAPVDGHGKVSDTGLLAVSKKGGRGSGKRNSVGGWRPMHQKGAAIWRKISDSFSRSLDSWKECNSGHERINPECAGSKASLDCSLSPASTSRRHYRHSSSFGYRLYRVSHTSRQFTSSSYAASSGESLKNAANRTPNASYGYSSPDTSLPFLSVRKSFPVIARLSSEFGLDGHMLSKRMQSKHMQDEEYSPPEVTASGPSTPQGDPNALLKVMLKQSTAERSRRKHDEKHKRRNRKSLSLTRWKGKGKANVADSTLHTADSTLANMGDSKKLDKGKGKERKTTPKEPKEDKRRMSKEQEVDSGKKTASGFVVFESKDVKLRHPKPSRPGQVRKMANMYKEKEKSGMSINSKASSGISLKDGRQSFKQKASSALGLRDRRGNTG